MGKASRDKGAAGEREVAVMFRAAGYAAERVPNSGGLRIKGDLVLHDVPLNMGDRVVGTANVLRSHKPWHVEVKRAERYDIPGWMRQAETDAPAASVPLLCFRKSRGKWYAMLALDSFLEIA